MSKHKHIDPKPTEYRGITYESRLEARWAVLLDNTPNVLHFKYHPETWRIPNGWTYTPDFLITYSATDHNLCKLYIEVKPAYPNPGYIEVLQAMTKHKRKTLFILAGSIYDPLYMEIQSSIIEEGSNPQAVSVEAVLKDFINSYVRAANYRFDL